MASVAPGIDLLPSGRFRWRIKIDGIPYHGVTDTLAKARQERQATKLARGGSINPDAVTVQELLDMWLGEQKSARATEQARNYALDRVPPEFLARPATEVTPPVVASVWHEMKRSVSPHIIAEARKALSGAWQQGVEWGIAPSNPIRAVKFKKPDAREIDPPATETVVRLIDYFAHPRAPLNPDRRHSRKQPLPAMPDMAAWCQIMATIGTRPGEACALRWDRFDAKTKVLRVGHTTGAGGVVTEGKIGRQGWRDLELDDETIAYLRAVPRIVGIPWVFHVDGEPWAVRHVRRMFTRACAVLEIDDVHPYSLRHYAVTNALNEGRPIHEVAAMVGDNPATVLKTYARWCKKPVAGAVASNAAALSAARRARV